MTKKYEDNKKRNKWTDEEINYLKENYEKKGVTEVSKIIIKHTKASITKKAQRLGLKVNKSNYYYNIEDIKNAVKKSYSFADVFRILNKSKSGDSYKVLKNIIRKNNLNISHFEPYRNNINYLKSRIKPISFWLKENTNIHSSNLKNKLYKEGLKERICELCGQDENWKGNKISLILDHINGINNDNRIENLRIVCPNCNAGLKTHCRGHKYLKKNKENKVT